MNKADGGPDAANGRGLVLLGGAIAGVAGVAAWMVTRRGSTSQATPSEDPKEGALIQHELIWPIPLGALLEIHESVTAHRKGSGRPHKGVDLLAPAGTQVLSVSAGRVLRVVNSSRAGLFVDVRGRDGRIYRYLHLHDAAVKEGLRLRAGDAIGTIAPTGESGVFHSRPHLHFEIRSSDWDRKRQDYGPPIDPLAQLPLRLLPRKVRTLIA